MTAPAVDLESGRGAVRRYFACLRPQDIVVLQGSPLLGAAFALGRPGVEQLAPLALLVAANILLVTHIFMLNDWSGLTADLADPNKATRVFTARGVGRGEMAALAATLLVASLAIFGALSLLTAGIALAIAALSALYSLPRFDWKGRPLLNSLLHLSGGLLHVLLGYSLGGVVDRRGVAIGCFFALVFAAGHLTQEVRDVAGDRANGIRTNAVAFGERRAFGASLALFGTAHLALVALALGGALPRPLAWLVALYAVQLKWSIAALREGLGYPSVSRLQGRYRMLYAAIGVAMLAAAWWPA